MIVSMTGYGRGEVKNEECEIVAEVRSVNNRFLDVQMKLPRNYFHYEQEVKNIIRNYVTRGRINVYVGLKLNTEENGAGLVINREPARVYWKLLQQLKKEFKIRGRIKLEHLLQFPDIISYEEGAGANEAIWHAIEQAIIIAMENLQEMRRREGQELAKDLEGRIQLLDKRIAQIEAISSSRMGEELAKLRQQIQAILPIEGVDEARLETEIALMINRIDVTEECVRFHSHNKMFLDVMVSEDVVGRKLNFLLQEMTREANTIGAKANHADIAHLVVEIKEEVEKIREQVQNIE
ncbi:MAG: YicC family protein [candidate division KSB1 bacterium]|nr:YicC family protein [candidate division KSB1 bacterium]